MPLGEKYETRGRPSRNGNPASKRKPNAYRIRVTTLPIGYADDAPASAVTMRGILCRSTHVDVLDVMCYRQWASGYCKVYCALVEVSDKVQAERLLATVGRIAFIDVPLYADWAHDIHPKLMEGTITHK